MNVLVWSSLGQVTIRIRATILENFEKIYRSTVFKITAILICLEHNTRVVTTARCPQLIGTLAVDISSTSYTMSAPIGRRAKILSSVEPINKRDIVEVQVVILV
jgi:hypothetical protein